ncbi:MAG: HDIG domain-containing protein [Leptospiraceae bacterium]|nr:HDIG domain-containing protein [Leptospiraceae bacterium]
MTPFVSDHPDYYPPPHLKDWLQNRGEVLPFTLQDLSGESLRYFRSKNPVAVFRVSASLFESIASFQTESLDEFLQASSGPGEIKWMVSLPGISDDYHLRFLRREPEGHNGVQPSGFGQSGHAHASGSEPDSLVAEPQWDGAEERLVTGLSSEYQPFELSVDTLCFDGQTWSGNEQARADYLAGVLRPLEGTDLALHPSTSDVLRIPGVASMLDFDLEPSFRSALKGAWSEEKAGELNRKFLRKCFQKIVCGARPSTGFLIMDELGALDWFLPDLAKGKGLTQNRYHSHDIFHHLIYACDAVDEPILKLRLAALLHDIGKSDTRREQPGGEATFHNHEVVGARITERIMRRFGFDSNLGKRVRFLVRNHMFHYTSEWSDRAVRRFMQKVSPSQLEDLIALRLADRKGSGKRQALPRAIKDLIRHIEEIKRQERELKVRDLKIGGNDLMELGMKPGPEMGDLLKSLLDQVKAEEIPNDRDALLEAARRQLLETIA